MMRAASLGVDRFSLPRADSSGRIIFRCRSVAGRPERGGQRVHRVHAEGVDEDVRRRVVRVEDHVDGVVLERERGAAVGEVLEDAAPPGSDLVGHLHPTLEQVRLRLRASEELEQDRDLDGRSLGEHEVVPDREAGAVREVDDMDACDALVGGDDVFQLRLELRAQDLAMLLLGVRGGGVRYARRSRE
jgi:hypothetical protein